MQFLLNILFFIFMKLHFSITLHPLEHGFLRGHFLWTPLRVHLA